MLINSSWQASEYTFVSKHVTILSRCMYIYLFIYVCVWIHIHMNACLLNKCTYHLFKIRDSIGKAHICIQGCIYVEIYIYAHTHTYLYSYMNIFSFQDSSQYWQGPYMYIEMHICRNLHICTYTYIFIFTYEDTFFSRFVTVLARPWCSQRLAEPIWPVRFTW